MQPIYLPLLSLLFFVLPQVLTSQWQSLELFDAPTVTESDHHLGVATLPNGDVITAGYRTNSQLGGCSAALSLRRSGSVIYERFYNQGGTICDRRAHDLAYDAVNDRIILAGETGGSPILHFIDPANGNLLSSPFMLGNGAIKSIDLVGNNLYLIGDYSGTLNIGGTLVSGGEVFVAQLDLNGIPQQILSVPSAWTAFDIKAAATGEVYFSLSTRSNINFGGGVPGNYSGYSGSGTDFLVLATDATLVPQWAEEVSQSNFNIPAGSLPLSLLDNGTELAYGTPTGSNFLDAEIGRLRLSDGAVQGTPQQLSNRAVRDLTSVCDKVVAVGGHGGNNANRQPCNLTPHKMWLASFQLPTLSQNYLEESSTCASGEAIALTPTNSPVVAGDFWETSSLTVGSITQTVTQNEGAFFAEFYDPILAQPPCLIIPCVDSLSEKTFSLYLNVQDSIPESNTTIDYATSVLRAPGNKIVFGGQAASNINSAGLRYVSQLDDAGNLILSPELLDVISGDELFDAETELIPIRDILGNISGYIGQANLNNAGGLSRVLVTYNINLQPTLFRRFPDIGGNGLEEITAVIQNSNNDYIVTGNYTLPGGQRAVFALEILSGFTIGDSRLISESGRQLNIEELVELAPSATNPNARYVISGTANGNEAVYFVLDNDLNLIYEAYQDPNTTGSSSVESAGLTALPNGGFAQLVTTRDQRLFLAYYPVVGDEVAASYYLLNVAGGKERGHSLRVSGRNLLIGGRAQEGPNFDYSNARAFLLSFDPISGTPNWVNTYGDSAYPAGAVLDIQAEPNGILLTGYGIDAVGAVSGGFDQLNHFDSWVAATDDLGRIADCDCYESSTVAVEAIPFPSFSLHLTQDQPGNQGNSTNAPSNDYLAEYSLFYCVQDCPGEPVPPNSVCANNLVVNGDLETGSPTNSDEDIDQAVGWGPIWTTNNGNSTGDFYGASNPPPSVLTAPLPVSQSQWAGFWVSHINDFVFREGVMVDLNTVVLQSSATYELSFELAALINIGTGTTQLAVYGVETNGPAPAPSSATSPSSSTLFANQQLLGIITIPASLDENFTNFQILFNANTLPSTGINHLVFTNADSGSGREFVALDDVCLRQIEDCCQDEEYFFSQVLPGIVVDSINPSTFEVSNAFAGPCHQVTIDWGDGTIEGPFSGSQLPKMHNYTGASNDQICVLIQEFSPDGNICFQEQLCFNYVTPTREIEEELGELRVYPNPTSGEIQLALPAGERIQRIELLDGFGRLLDNLDPGLASYNLSDYPHGFYLLRVATMSGKKAIRRLIIQ